MNIYPLCDCVQIPLDPDYNTILLCYYTDNPCRPYDAFIRKEYDIPNEIPLYLCKELWVWNGNDYEKKEYSEDLVDKDEVKVLLKKYLKYQVSPDEWDDKYTTKYNKTDKVHCSLLLTSCYNLGNGGRWNRAWTIDEDSVNEKYGDLY